MWNFADFENKLLLLSYCPCAQSEALDNNVLVYTTCVTCSLHVHVSSQILLVLSLPERMNAVPKFVGHRIV